MRPLRRVTIIGVGGIAVGRFDAGTHRITLDSILGVVRIRSLATGLETWVSRSRCVVEP